MKKRLAGIGAIFATLYATLLVSNFAMRQQPQMGIGQPAKEPSSFFLWVWIVAIAGVVIFWIVGLVVGIDMLTRRGRKRDYLPKEEPAQEESEDGNEGQE